MQGIHDTTIYAEKLYSINLTKTNKKFCLSLHCNGIIKFKAKDSEIVAKPLCIENISKLFSVDNMKKIGLNEYVYDFNVDCDAIAVDDI